jgi:hypothetical protein
MESTPGKTGASTKAIGTTANNTAKESTNNQTEWSEKASGKKESASAGKTKLTVKPQAKSTKKDTYKANNEPLITPYETEKLVKRVES